MTPKTTGENFLELETASARRLPDVEEYLPPWATNPLRALLESFLKSVIMQWH